MQDEVKVIQADERAVAEFHRQSFKTLFATTDADIDAGINRAHTLLCQAFARHRHQAERETMARMERFIEGFCKSLEMGDFANVEGALAERMCCNGQMCGCQGSTVGGYLAYELRSCFKDALPPAPEAGQ